VLLSDGFFFMADVAVRSPLTSPVHPYLIGLRSDLRSARNFLNVFSLNVRRIVPKLTELRTFLVPSLFHMLAFSKTCLKSRHSNQLVAFDGFNVFRCDRSRAAGGAAALFVNRSIKATLAYKSAAGSYFGYVLVSFHFNDVSILVGPINNPDRLHFDEVRAFLDLLALVSLNFDHLIVLGYFKFDVLLDPEHSSTSRYRDILDSLTISFLLVPPIVTRPAFGTSIDNVLTKFPEKVVSFGTRFSSVLSNHCILTFSYCIRPPLRVDRFVS
jgi:hypothetical protein